MNVTEATPLTEPALTPPQLAERWGVSEKTLRRWRRLGVGPTYAKSGSFVRYLMPDVLAYEGGARRVVS